MLKLSGEALASEYSSLDNEKILSITKTIQALQKDGKKIALVSGGGNIWRFRDKKDVCLDRTESDRLGMLATIMNATALKASLESKGVSAKVYSSIVIQGLTFPWHAMEARKQMDEGTVIICAGGTGNPYFSTDSGAALRGLELECDILIKATKVDGLYSENPTENPNAQKFSDISFEEVLDKRLQAMDLSAFTLCFENNFPIIITKMSHENILQASNGKTSGTFIH